MAKEKTILIGEIDEEELDIHLENPRREKESPEPSDTNPILSIKIEDSDPHQQEELSMSPLIKLDFSSPPDKSLPQPLNEPKESVVEGLKVLSFVEEVKENATSYQSRLQRMSYASGTSRASIDSESNKSIDSKKSKLFSRLQQFRDKRAKKVK